MTILEEEVETETTPPTPKPDKPMEHLVCCSNYEKSFCGTEIDPTTVHMRYGDTADDCVVCIDLSRGTTNECPAGLGICPKRTEDEYIWDIFSPF